MKILQNLEGVDSNVIHYRHHWVNWAPHFLLDHSNSQVCLITTIKKWWYNSIKKRPPFSSPIIIIWSTADKINKINVCMYQGTLRRSPLEQYSMAKRGKSFKAMCFISSGTSLAVTTFKWFNLPREIQYYSVVKTGGLPFMHLSEYQTFHWTISLLLLKKHLSAAHITIVLSSRSKIVCGVCYLFNMIR